MRTQGVIGTTSCQGSPQVPHGRGGKTHAVQRNQHFERNRKSRVPEAFRRHKPRGRLLSSTNSENKLYKIAR